jgi:hypothetical protein
MLKALPILNSDKCDWYGKHVYVNIDTIKSTDVIRIILSLLNSCVNLTAVAQWLRLALSKGANLVGVFSTLHMRTETDPVSETSCFYSQEHRTMEKVQKKTSNYLCYTWSSEPFKIYLLSWAQSMELIPISGHQHKHKIGYTIQAQDKSSARAEADVKNILKTHNMRGLALK